MMQQAITIELTSRYADFTLDVDLKLPGSGVSVLFGHSGSGKTSLLRCLAGLDRGQGRVVIGNETWQDGDYFVPTHKRPLGYVFQEASLFPHLSVKSNLLYGLKRIFMSPQNSDLEHLVDLLDIGDLMKRKPARLSGGERQRVAIAQALLLKPKILLMDEPLAALDQARKQAFFPYLERLHAEFSMPVLYVTHDRAEVMRLADRVVVLEQGRVVRQGCVEDVFADELTLSRRRRRCVESSGPADSSADQVAQYGY
jgi:molybdate transport system ATP-binding protein